MSKQFEDRGIKGSKIRLSNSSWFVVSSADNKSDVPVFRVNEDNKIEFADLPTVKERGELSVDETPNHGHFLGENFTITNTMLSTKSITLTNTPSHPSQVLLLPLDGGIVQSAYANDFVVSGNILSWAGKGLDGLLSVNDKVTVFVPL